MPIAVENTPGTFTLAQLQQVIRNTEEIMGRLCTFGAGETDDTPINLMSFEDTGAPGEIITLEEVFEGNAPSKPGHVLICLARTFVGGQLKLVAAFRPTT